MTECSVCGLLYCSDEPDDRRQHARFHASYMKPRRPKPDARLAAYAGDVRVDAKSPRWLNRLIYARALALKRDERLDFPQWDEDGPPEARACERDLHAILLVEQTVPVGAAGFVFVNWENRPPGWHMFLAWVADDWRRRGVMSRRWPIWRRTYGDFTVEQPSEAMQAFLRKMEEHAEAAS
jgi:hypothetical protein